ncbi:phytoene desaturase family protein [Sandaracinus amylolyticus]|uniref:Phytoene dehydrogenase n=1 Tax=Sandaracinus amylolyticus TaxID=927083 RepID=A0A0F6YGK4_9BACT|nr:NAD(P)/FAD-dependent oxidoreductase [Sandaracinus amylolyticus]AKF04813.1 Phytoene dehydrogenase [Sandaracinus amylolyticus]
MPERWDAIVVGAGPNGLAAACTLAHAGRSVLVLEAAARPGGGTRTEEITERGFKHDICSAIHPMGAASPFFRTIDLRPYGLEWVHPELALAHPFDDGSAMQLHHSLDATVDAMGDDGKHWRRLFQPFLDHTDALLDETLGPLRIPRRMMLMARFGLRALRSAEGLTRAMFGNPKTRAMFGGISAHALVPLHSFGTASFGLMLILAGHKAGWPAARGGSIAISDAMIAYLRERGCEVRTEHRVTSLRELPESKAVLFDLGPHQVARVAADALPLRYRNALLRWRYGPGVFKVDWALDEPIPWKNEACRRAGTVHLANTWEELAETERAVSRGEVSERPFVLVAQQSLFDDTRAPKGKHTGWAYIHVPHGSTIDATERIESQIERFAPGFRDVVRARHVIDARALEAHDENMIGGDIGGGANDLWQLVWRPMVRWDPYTTPNPSLFLCSSSTPPGGGVHGMCGWHAAQRALRGVLR